MKRGSFPGIALLAACSLAAACRKPPSENFTVSEHPTLSSLTNVHGSPERSVTICGRTFHRPKGVPPYHLRVPESDLVLFAYEPVRDVKTLVICETSKGIFHEIDLDGVQFGTHIGSGKASGEEWGDIVESVSGRKLHLLGKGFRYTERSVVDLEDDSIKVLEFESPDRIIDLGNRSEPPK